jgi:hypothetical protein
MGLAAIGRPSNMAGTEMLAELLKDLPADRPVLVVGEFDPHPDGKWPGREGAVQTATDLAAKLGRPVQWVLTPGGHKDARAWAIAQGADRACANAWADLGERFLQELRANKPNTISPPSAKEPEELGTLLSAVRPQRVEWLWPGRIPLGKLTILDGDPGLGKSVLTLDLAARVSRGLDMPLNEREPGVEDRPPAGVVLLSAEDGLEDTIRPRLDAAGADVERILALDKIQERTGTRLPTLPADVPYLGDAIRRVEAHLVVIDPLSAFLGGETNTHKDQDVRKALHPLAVLAQQTGAAIVVVRHLNKLAGGNPLYRGGGSIGIIGAARSGLLVAKDPDNPDHRVLASTKCNLARLPASLTYDLSTAGNGALRVGWIGPSAHTAESLLAAPHDDEDRGAVQEAVEVLRSILEAGPVPSEDAKREARKAGVAEKTLHRAKDFLGVKSRKMGFSGKGVWQWALPGHTP